MFIDQVIRLINTKKTFNPIIYLWAVFLPMQKTVLSLLKWEGKMENAYPNNLYKK